jgi:hypothetical protein
MSNLILNPQFTSKNNWTSLSDGDVTTTTPSNENNISSVLKVDYTTASSGNPQNTTYQDISNLTGGTTYYLRYYIIYKGSFVTPGRSLVTISLVRDPTNLQLDVFTPEQHDSAGPNNTWTKVTHSFTAQSGQTYRFKINHAISSQHQSDIYYITDIYVGTSSSYCFNKGTEILCLKNNEEKYIPIESINKETDLVKTYKNGYKRVEGVYHSLLKNNIDNYRKSMYIMKKQENMTNDLIVTGGHSILIDDYDNDKIKNKHKKIFGNKLDPIDDKQLLLAGQTNTFTQIQDDNFYDIYHLVLEDENGQSRRYGIWANGVLTESAYKNIIKSE